MNFEQYDIEKSKAYLLGLLESGTLNVEVDKIDEFIDFIINNTSSDSLKETLLQAIQIYSITELRDLEERFIKDYDFEEIISKSFQVEKRRQLKKNLIQLDTELEEASFNEIIEKAFQTEKREELKKKLKALDVEALPKKGKVVLLRPYFRAISIAASIILILVVWQPQHSSDTKLFAVYSNSIDNSSINDFTQAELIKEQGRLRGEEEHFRNYSYNETLQLLEAIELEKQKNFEKAKEVFNSLHVEKEKNPGLALYLSIAQLNTGDLDVAIKNLDYLAQLSNFSYQDEAKFHLAFAYLKSGERNKAKGLLHELVSSKSKFSDQAQQSLNKIRWF